MVGAQPAEGSQIPGIRKWPEAYLPKIFDRSRVDAYESIVQADAETMARRLAAEEGIFAGISSAGALVAALRVAERVNDATIVFIVCDRGDRYLSTGVFRRFHLEAEFGASLKGRRDGPAKPAPCGLD